jgi:hypothetical protein
MKDAPTPDPLTLVNASSELETAYSKEITAKVRVGLTRQQAIDVIKEQIRHDAALKAASEEKKPTPAKA